jgi:hypothetical protein
MAKERVGKRQRNHDAFLKKSVTSFFQMYETKQNIKKQLARYTGIWRVLLQTLPHFWWPRKCLHIHGGALMDLKLHNYKALQFKF